VRLSAVLQNCNHGDITSDDGNQSLLLTFDNALARHSMASVLVIQR